MIQFILNNKEVSTKEKPGITVLDFVRYHKHLCGTKIGCREGDCGACNILEGKLIKGKMHYQNMTSCLMPLTNAHGKHIVTIEGINMQHLNIAQQAMVNEGGTQCGFCTVGFIVSMTGYCMINKAANYKEAIASVDGNICRCTGYKSIERACRKLVNDLKDKSNQNPIVWLVQQKYLPEYFTGIPKRLKKIAAQTSLTPIQQKVKTNSTPVGGGTDLYVQQPEEMLEQPAHYLFDNSELKKIYTKAGYIYIGATATVTDILESNIMQKHFPKLVAGNFANASPIGDLTIFFLALNSELILSVKEKERIIALNKFYLGYKKLSKKSNELIRVLTWILRLLIVPY